MCDTRSIRSQSQVSPCEPGHSTSASIGRLCMHRKEQRESPPPSPQPARLFQAGGVWVASFECATTAFAACIALRYHMNCCVLERSWNRQLHSSRRRCKIAQGLGTPGQHGTKPDAVTCTVGTIAAYADARLAACQPWLPVPSCRGCSTLQSMPRTQAFSGPRSDASLVAVRAGQV